MSPDACNWYFSAPHKILQLNSKSSLSRAKNSQIMSLEAAMANQRFAVMYFH